MSRLALYLLGPPRVEVNGKEVHIGRRKAVALLAYLATTGQRHSRDALATLLWPEYDQSRARADLRRTLSLLNRTLGVEWLTADRETAGLEPDAELWLDVAQFRQQLAACETHGHAVGEACAECVPHLEKAIDLYRDDFLAGFTLRDSLAFDEWQFFQTQKLRDELAGALERLVSWHSSQEAYEAAIPYARRWLALDPLHEPAHRRLMELYARAGQKAAALRQYQLLEGTLAEELGVRPSGETRALFERVRSGEELVPERGATPVPPHNLPPQPTPFIGREVELTDLDRLIADPDVRLVTIVGPGGMGKTRLALACAERQLNQSTNLPISRFPNGVFFVPLAPLSDTDHIIPTLAGALNFQLQGGAGETRTPKGQLLDYLRQKRTLLIMDNLEHLLDGVALLVDILHTAPEVQIMATSRERLHLREEQVYPIEGLEFPDWETGRAHAVHAGAAHPTDATEYSAVKLFLQSARRAQPRFEPASDDVASLTRVCRLLGGMPLAIEIAAGWTEALSVDRIAAEIQKGLDFLETDVRAVPERHRSMQAVIDPTWERLSQTEQETFGAMSVFRGGFTLEAAAAAAGATLRTLLSLVNKSLLGFDRRRDRYDVHELLRQYAAEKLAQDPKGEAAAQDAHSAYYCTALGGWEADLKSARQGTAVAEIEADYENVRVAWMRALEGADLHENLGNLALAVNGLGEFHHAQLRWSGGGTVFQKAAEKLQALYGLSPATATAARLLARFLAWQVSLNLTWSLASVYGEHEEQLLRQGLALLAGPALAEQDTRAEEAFIRLQLGRPIQPHLLLAGALSREQVEQGRGHLEASLRLYRKLGDVVGAADVLYELHLYARGDGAPERARRLVSESLALRRQTGEPRRMAWSLIALGDVTRYDSGAYDEAREIYEQAFAASRAGGQLVGMVTARANSAWLAWFLGEFDAALSYLEEMLALSRQAGGQLHVAVCLVQIGLTHAYRGQFSRAVALIQEGVGTDQRQDNDFTKSVLAFAHIHAGRYEAGRGLAGAVVLDEGPWAAWAARLLGWVALAEEKYAEALASSQRGVAIHRVDESHAWSQAPLGRALHGLGRCNEAKRELYEALGTCVEIRAFLPLMHLMPVIPVVLVDDEDDGLKERGVELYAMAESLPFVANSRLFEDIAGRHIRAATATLPPEAFKAARARGRGLDWWATAAELLEELRELGWANPSN